MTVLQGSHKSICMHPQYYTQHFYNKYKPCESELPLPSKAHLKGARLCHITTLVPSWHLIQLIYTTNLSCKSILGDIINEKTYG